MGVPSGVGALLWFSQEDACRHALAAYALAIEACKPPDGEPWLYEGQPWATEEDFAVHFIHCFTTRLHEQGQASGHPFGVSIAGAGCDPLAAFCGPNEHEG